MDKMKLSDYFYDLPEELIAQDPLEKRDESRVLVLGRDSGEISHKTFKNVIDFLRITGNGTLLTGTTFEIWGIRA